MIDFLIRFLPGLVYLLSSVIFFLLFGITIFSKDALIKKLSYLFLGISLKNIYVSFFLAARVYSESLYSTLSSPEKVVIMNGFAVVLAFPFAIAMIKDTYLSYLTRSGHGRKG